MLHRIPAVLLIGLTTLMFAPTDVSADHARSPYSAACVYRDIVRDFERLSDRVHCLDRYTETAIDRLYGASNSLRSAARNPRNFERILDRYYDVVGLHRRVEAGLASGPVDPRLAACWVDVQRAFVALTHEIELLGPLGVQPAIQPPAYTVPPPPTVVPSTRFQRTDPSLQFQRSPFGSANTVFPNPSVNATRPPFASPLWNAPRIQGPDRIGQVAPELNHRPGLNWNGGFTFGTPPSIAFGPGHLAPANRDFGRRQLSTPSGSLFEIGAQLMRMID